MKRNGRNTRINRNHKNSKKTFNTKKFIKFACLIIVFIISIFLISKLPNFIKTKSQNSNVDISSIYEQDIIEENKKEVNPEKKEDISFTIAALGDVLCHNTQYWDAYDKSTDTYDFSYVFDDIRDYTKNADLCITNLETSFAGKERGYSNYPTFNSPDSLANALQGIGVDIITTAGNHCLDMGFSGLSRTIDVIKNAGIDQLGTYKTKEERDKVFIKEVKGVKIAFVNYSYGTNGIPVPSDKPYCVNLINKDLIKKDIEAAKKENPDVIIACMHWGVEYQTKANSEQKDLADYLFKNGVNIIIGNHPHVPQQMEKRTVTLDDGSTREGFVIYALGNFTADQNYENTRNSLILNLTVTKHSDGEITIDKANYIPTYIYKNKNVSLHKFKVLDLEKTLNDYATGADTSIGLDNYNYLKTQLENIKKIVGEPF